MNRQGKLTDEKQAELEKRFQRRMWLHVGLAILVIVVGGGLYFAMSSGALVIDTGQLRGVGGSRIMRYVPLLAGVLAIFPFVFIFVNYRGLGAAREQKVGSYQGNIQHKRGDYGGHIIKAGKHDFSVKEDVYNAFKENHEYTIYYLKTQGLLLSVEATDPAFDTSS
jgi:uncharacterized membrane protein